MTTIVERVGALSVGRIEAVTAAELRVALFNETPQATALNTGVPIGFPRINAYLLIPNETGAVVAVVREISIIRSRPVVVGRGNEGLVDLPFPTRSIIAIPLGTLLREGQDADGQPLCAFERGVPVLPSVGDPVLLPTAAQLRSVVEAKPDDRLVHVGAAPFAANAHVWVHPDKLFGRHLAVLGNTGSGKSCSVAGIIRWSLEASVERISDGAGDRPPNARFIILDPNGEYAEAFKDRSPPIRHYSVGGQGEKKPLVVPGWLWNGQEWAAFTSAQPQVQRPLLFKALRLARNAASSVLTARAHVVRRYHNYVRQIEQLCPELPQSVTGNYRSREFGHLLEGLLGLTRTDEAALLQYGPDTADLVAAIVAIRTPIEEVRASRHWTSQNSPGGYNSFQPNDVFRVLEELHTITGAFPIGATHGEIGEDEPVPFDVMMLPEHIHDVAMATGGQALSNVEPLIDRIQIMLGNARLRQIVNTAGVNSLTDWLNDLLGSIDNDQDPVAILDLSLVPSDVVHIAVAVIARLVLEALQRHLMAWGSALPTVLVLEEAHVFVRKDTDVGASVQAAELCRQTFERVAREGRKFGLGLVLASQRPSELSPTVLAQCNSFLLHRLVNDIDQNLVRRLVPDALGEVLKELPTLPSQQAILLGWAVPTPVLIRIRDLAQRPRSADPAFWATWLHQEGRTPDWQSLAPTWEGSVDGPHAAPEFGSKPAV